MTEAVESGDIIKLDFDGSVDGVPFEGGKAENYTLTIGSGSFIPGFEDQLIGTKIGEERDVTVTFPEDYHVEEPCRKRSRIQMQSKCNLCKRASGSRRRVRKRSFRVSRPWLSTKRISRRN